MSADVSRRSHVSSGEPSSSEVQTHSSLKTASHLEAFGVPPEAGESLVWSLDDALDPEQPFGRTVADSASPPERQHLFASAADVSFRRVLQQILLGGGCLWLLFALVADPPFALYSMLVNGLFVAIACAYNHRYNNSSNSSSSSRETQQKQQQKQQPSGGCLGRLGIGTTCTNGTWSKRWVAALTALALLLSTTALSFLREFELRDLANFETPVIPGISAAASDSPDDGGSLAAIRFYQIYNPQLSYMDDVEAIHRHINAKPSDAPADTLAVGQPVIWVQRYEVDKQLNAWSSDVLRYNFLLQFWRQTSARSARASTPGASSKPQTHIVCLVESDVVFHERYFTSILREHQAQREARNGNLELAHIQHFWGHQVLEPFNIGILCTSSHASLRTRLWVRLMSVLHAKRYRRLLYLDFLYAFVRERLVFFWDQHLGCTQYFPHCRYIHFTRPKGDGIAKAVQAIAEEKIQC